MKLMRTPKTGNHIETLMLGYIASSVSTEEERREHGSVSLEDVRSQVSYYLNSGPADRMRLASQ